MHFQDIIQKQTQRKAELESYQLLLIEIEAWLRDINLNDVVTTNNDEIATIENIGKYQKDIKELFKKQKTLAAIKAKCDNFSDYEDIKLINTTLSNQLTHTDEVIRLQLINSNEKLHILETHLTDLRKKPTHILSTPSEDTIDLSSSMPDHVELSQKMNPLSNEVETQTSESHEIKKPAMIESAAQTIKDKKKTENICVTQTQSKGHEMIKIESTPNPCTSEHMEDVFVDARYKQPSEEMNKSTELILRNVPQTAFETIFVEPDNTTTEVVVDADGRKQIIVRKVTQTYVHHEKVVEQKQQLTKISSIVGSSNEPIEQCISSPTNSAVDTGLKTTKMTKSRAEHSVGESVDNLIVQAVVENPANTNEEVFISNIPITQHSPDINNDSNLKQSCVQTVTHHLTQRIIRRKKKVIRRVTIINGVEHVTEEVIEEPEEVEITEDHAPGVSINVMQITDNQDDVFGPIVELPADEEDSTQPDVEVVNEPLIISDNKTKENLNKGKTERVPIEDDDEEKDSQVFSDFEQPAQVDLVDNAQVDGDLQITAISDVNLVKLAAKTTGIQSSSNIEQLEDNEDKDKFEHNKSNIVNVFDIWPSIEPSQIAVPLQTNILVNVKKIIHEKNTPYHDSILCENIWPLNDKLGHDMVFETYTFEEQPVKAIDVSELELKPSNAAELEIGKEIANDINVKEKSNISQPKPDSLSEEITEIQSVESEKSAQVSYSIEKMNEEIHTNLPGKIGFEQEMIENTAIEPQVQVSPQQILQTESTDDVPSHASDSSINQNLSKDATQKTYLIEKNKRKKKKNKKRNNNEIKSEEAEVSHCTLDQQFAVVTNTEDEQLENVKDVVNAIERNDLKIVIEKYDINPQKNDENLVKPKIDVRSATQLFIDHELNVSDGTTRTVKLVMSPKEPSSPGSITVKMRQSVSEQPKLNVNLVEERLDSKESSEPLNSELKSTDIHISEDNTISDEMEMPEIETTPVASNNDMKLIISTEQELILSSEGSYKSISELEQPVKIIEECVISSSSSSLKPLTSEVIIPSEVIEEEEQEIPQHGQTIDAEQQTDINIGSEKNIIQKNVHSRSMQTTPEKVVQTLPINEEAAIIVQSSDNDIKPRIETTEKICEEVSSV